MNTLEQRIVDFPDLSYVHYCETEFGINRGIYNVVDNWFFQKGLIDIIERREYILVFFQEICHAHEKKKNGGPKFGKSGLTLKLNEFIKNRSII